MPLHKLPISEHSRRIYLNQSADFIRHANKAFPLSTKAQVMQNLAISPSPTEEEGAAASFVMRNFTKEVARQDVQPFFDLEAAVRQERSRVFQAERRKLKKKTEAVRPVVGSVRTVDELEKLAIVAPETPDVQARKERAKATSLEEEGAGEHSTEKPPKKKTAQKLASYDYEDMMDKFKSKNIFKIYEQV